MDMNPATSLAGRSALVTGGARRIGRTLSLALARSGADVTVAYRNSESDAAETVAMIQALGRRAHAILCDVRSETSVRDAVAEAAKFHGGLNVLVNNAAVFETAPLDTLTLAQWDAMFETNTRGPFLMAREALPYLRAARGRIVNLGSLGGLRAWAGHAHYCASKAALHMLTQAMAKSFAPEVSVNCVAPGWIEMPYGAGGMPESERAGRLAAKTPLGRNGTAEEVADAVVFFAAGPAFVTGQILAVDGGLGL